ncbi:MAG: DUF4492 domain-containing protein [Porphyromonadaceae bacterium]|nr:DUF4492 domain-containing protein [Porphyromonadaceae bacterium]
MKQDIKRPINPFKRVYRFYRDGFRGLTPTSRMLWLIIGLKLFVMFAILKAFFFPNHTKHRAAEQQITGSEYVQQELINRGQQ